MMTRITLFFVYCISFPYLFADTLSKLPWEIECTTYDEKKISLEEWKGKVLLIVNIATECGLSSQIGELEKLKERIGNTNFEILSFPSNDFFSQEPRSNSEIQTFCSLQYATDFPIFAKIHVRKEPIHPLFIWLTDKSIQGSMGGKISWNYTKFIIDTEGQLVDRFSPFISPLDEKIENRIRTCLQKCEENKF